MREDYVKKAALYQDWLAACGLAPATPATLLLHLLDFIDEMFLEGANHNDTTKVVGAVRFLVREVENFAMSQSMHKSAGASPSPGLSLPRHGITAQWPC